MVLASTADVAMSGDRSSLVIDVHLGLCIGDIGGATGAAIYSLGFPIAVISDFAGVDFTEQCKCAPECS